MSSSLRSHVRSIGAYPHTGWTSVLGGIGVLVWGGLLFGFFNGYLGSTEFQHGVRRQSR